MKKSLLLLSIVCLITNIKGYTQDEIEFLKESVLFYYPLEVDGMDYSPRVNDAEVHTSITFEEGKYGNAARFSSVDLTFIAAPENLFLYGEQPSGDIANYTFSFWVKQEGDLSIRQDLCQQLPDDNGVWGKTIFYRINATQFRSSAHTTANCIVPPKADDWQHIAIVLNQVDKIKTIYIDGVKDAEVTGWVFNPIEAHGGVVYGAHDTAGLFAFEGLMDEIYLFEAALTEDQVITVMNSEGLFTNNAAIHTGLLPGTSINVNNKTLGISLNESLLTEISIYDIAGRKVFADQIETSTYSKNLNLNNGIYIVKLNNNKGSICKKIYFK